MKCMSRGTEMNNTTGGNYTCPCCGEMLGFKVNKRYVKFCPNCGQSLQ